MVIHMKESLNIKSIFHLYIETHTVSHIRTRLRGDSTVNNAINCTLQREGSWTTKGSTAVQCELAYMNAKTQSCVEGEVAELPSKENSRVTDIAKKHMQKEHRDQCI